MDIKGWHAPTNWETANTIMYSFFQHGAIFGLLTKFIVP